MDLTDKTSTSWFHSTSVSVERYFIFSSLALIVIFAWMEPSGAAGIGLWKGLVFWTIQVSILIPLLITVQHLASHYIKFKVAHLPWVQTFLSGVISSLIFVPIGYILDTLFAIPGNESPDGLWAGLLDEAGGVLVPVTVTWLALNAPWIFQLDFSRSQPQAPGPVKGEQSAPPSGITSPHSRFIEELQSRASGDLISISSELHYLRVTTTETEVMFLYNLKDAIEELPADSGVQIHRSHWVAKEHIKALKKQGGASKQNGGTTECVLSNGKRLPVSRRKYAEVSALPLVTKEAE